VVSGQNTIFYNGDLEEREVSACETEKRGAVALMMDEQANFLGVAILGLLTIAPLRHLLIDKPFM
jgi:hypothetical protein